MLYFVFKVLGNYNCRSGLLEQFPQSWTKPVKLILNSTEASDHPYK